MTKFAQLILLFFVFRVPSTRNVVSENLTQLDAPAKDFQKGLTELMDMMETLNSLADIQKKLQELQRVSEERMRAQHKEEELRETSRSKTLKTDRKLLEDLRETVHRKIKQLTKNTTQGEAQLVKRPKDCSDVYLEGDETTDVYKVWPLWNKDRKRFPVYCDMDTDGGGWTVIHRWKNPEVPKGFFHRSWNDYKNGFGDLESAFWIGNELMYELTSQGVYELRFDFEFENIKQHSVYDSFFIESEENQYMIHFGNYLANGTGGNILITSDSKNFTTQDRVNTPLKENLERNIWGEVKEYQCTPTFGWWFDNTCEINFKIHMAASFQKSTKSEMKIRQKSFVQTKASPP